MSTPPFSRPRPIRWAIAALVTLAMLLATTGVVVFAQTGSSGGPVFAPATTVAWVEVRLDLPGNQEEELAALLGHLPGFADPAALDAKINTLLNQVVNEVSSGAATWTGDVDPWSNRQFGLALLEFPASATRPDDEDHDDDDDDDAPALVAGLGVKDRATLEARLAVFLTQEPVATEQYAGATITTVDDDVSYAVTDQWLLVSPHAEDIKASLDVLSGAAPGLADDERFAVAAQRIPADRLAAFYLSLGSLRPLIESQLAGQQGAQIALGILDQLPVWLSGYAQAASDHLTVALDMQIPPSLPVPGMRETDLASRFPAETLVYLEMRDVGRTLHAGLEMLLSQVPAGDSEDLAALEQALGVPLNELLDPVEDAALGFGFPDGQPQIGIAATLSDPAIAQTRLSNVLVLARLLANRAQATVSDAQVAGTTVTTFALPADVALLGRPVTVSVAVADDRLYIGTGDFVEKALTRDPGASLASEARFANALATAGSPNAGFAFVDLSGAQAAIESMDLADEDFRTNVKPWLDALDSLVISASADQDALSAKLLLFVR